MLVRRIQAGHALQPAARWEPRATHPDFTCDLAHDNDGETDLNKSPSAEVALHNIFCLAIERIRQILGPSCAGAVMGAIEDAIFWLEVIWTPALVLTGYLLLPRPRD